ncbi:MAG: hypothetical protein J3Q66DRAFT_257372, partial [Benniella sp.]
FLILALALAMARPIAAQSIGDIPDCAQTCLLPALQATGCTLTDFTCSCMNKEFISGSTACILKECSREDAKAASIDNICKAVG